MRAFRAGVGFLVLSIVQAVLTFIPSISDAVTLYGSGEGHPSAFRWTVLPPNGGPPLERQGPVLELATPTAGLWTVHLAVEYLHQDPVTGQPYTANATIVLEVPSAVFADGFEDGSTSRWSGTQPSTTRSPP